MNWPKLCSFSLRDTEQIEPCCALVDLVPIDMFACAGPILIQWPDVADINPTVTLSHFLRAHAPCTTIRQCAKLDTGSPAVRYISPKLSQPLTPDS